MSTTFDALMDLRDKYRPLNGIQGTIRWFDGTSGEGMVELFDGQTLYCHFTAIHGIDKNNYAYPTLEDQRVLNRLGGRAITVVPYISPGYVGCDRVVLNDMVEGE